MNNSENKSHRDLMYDYLEKFEKLLQQARIDGVDVAIGTESLNKPRMGNTVPTIVVRPLYARNHGNMYSLVDGLHPQRDLEKSRACWRSPYDHGIVSRLVSSDQVAQTLQVIKEIAEHSDVSYGTLSKLVELGV